MNESDVLIVGAGVAGCVTAAALLAEGVSVTLIDMEAAPPWRVGEYVPPSAARLLRALGLEVAMAARYLSTTALRVLCARTGRTRVLRFDEGAEPSMGWHLPRADFSLFLRHFVKERGAALELGWRAIDPVLEGTEVCGVVAQTPDGRRTTLRAKVVVDASGPVRWLAERSSASTDREGIDATTLCGHYTAVEPTPGAEAAVTDVISFSHGWWWSLPMRGGVHSVGVSCTPTWARQRREGEASDAFFERTAKDASFVRTMLADARSLGGVRVLDVRSCARVEPAAGDRWIAVGSAAGAVDPVLGMDSAISIHGAISAADAIVRALHNGDTSERAWRAHCERQRRAERLAEPIARAAYKGVLADVALAADLSRAERQWLHAMARAELYDAGAEATEALVRARIESQ